MVDLAGGDAAKSDCVLTFASAKPLGIFDRGLWSFNMCERDATG